MCFREERRPLRGKVSLGNDTIPQLDSFDALGVEGDFWLRFDRPFERWR